MPTGYTVVLDEEVDEFEWLKATLVRNFGVAIDEREDTLKMSFKELDKKIRTPYRSTYYPKELKKARERLQELKDPVRASTLYEREIAANLKYEEKRKKEALLLKTKHDRAKGLLQAVLKEEVSQFTKDVARFGLDQLKLVEWETEPPEEDPLLAERPWIEKEIKACEWEINYCTKQMKEEQERFVSKLAYWEAFCKDIAKLEAKYRKRKF